MISPPTITKEEPFTPTRGICLDCGMSTDLTQPDYLPRHTSRCYMVTAPRTYAIEIVEWDNEKQAWL